MNNNVHQLKTQLHFEDTCGVSLLGDADVEAALRDICTYLGARQSAITTMSQVKQAVPLLVPPGSSPDRVFEGMGLIEALFTSIALSHLKERPDLGALAAVRILEKVKHNEYVSPREFERLEQLAVFQRKSFSSAQA